MTIQRKYQLPNCTLLLEGLSQSTGNDGQPTEVRPVLSMLVNAECYFPNAKQPLTGGRDFFESLVTAVSGYAQEFLSQVHHPEAHKQGAGLVRLQRVNDNKHRLIVQPADETELGVDTSYAAKTPIEIDLTTVQLFDLVDAVDQFFADSQTLPDLSLQLTPVSKRYARSGQQLAKQAVPATVGMSGLALAAIAFFFVPIPEIRRPLEPKPGANSTESTNLATAPAIIDPAQLVALNQKLKDQLQPVWKPQPTIIQQDLIYRVGVSANGEIKGYTAVNDPANAQVQLTPLPSLLSQPAPGNAVNPEPLAQFQVVFSPNGEVQVRPWDPTRK